MDASEVKQNHGETLHLVHFQAAGQRGTHHIPRWGGFLSLSELEEIVLDVEVCKNNRPLTYLEDDRQLLVLTPNSFLIQQITAVPELQSRHLEERDLKKRPRFLCTTKDGHGTLYPRVSDRTKGKT